MLLPTLAGVIRRRVLVNFRVDEAVMRKTLPAAFRPKLVNGAAMAGICLIRLEHVRPRGLPSFVGMSSENAAHRVAVLWTDASGAEHDGVYIPRRDSASIVNRLLGGRVFPGEHNAAAFHIDDDGEEIRLKMVSADTRVQVDVHGRTRDSLPPTSCFSSLEEASAFFRRGSLGYSENRQMKHLDGVRLRTDTWSMVPLEIFHVESSFFADVSMFPAGSVAFDSALVMRDIAHEWHGAPRLVRDPDAPPRRDGVVNGSLASART